MQFAFISQIALASERLIIDFLAKADAFHGRLIAKQVGFCPSAMAKQILIADDDDNDASALQAVLEASGVRAPVIIVRDGQQVVDYLRGEGQFSNRQEYPIPHILFLDLRMPKLTGFEVLEWLKDQTEFKGMLIIVMTGLERFTELQRVYDLGANTFMTKPFIPEDIAALMRAFPLHWSGLHKVNP